MQETKKPGVLQECRAFVLKNRGDSRPPTVNPYSYDTAVLSIFPEYIEFDGEDVLQLAVKKEPRKSTE